MGSDLQDSDWECWEIGLYIVKYKNLELGPTYPGADAGSSHES